jgi:putative inorganic carbon (hco3(-)) transporter
VFYLLMPLYLIALLIRPQDWFEPMKGLPTGYVISLTMTVVGAIAYLRERDKYAIPQNKMMPFYVLVVFVATLLSVDFSTGLDQGIAYFKRALVFFSVVWLVNSKERVHYTVACYLVLMVVLSIQAITQALTGTSWGGQTPEPGYTEIRVRWHGDWDGPNVFAMLFIIGIAMAIEYLFGPYGVMTRLFSLFVISMSFVAIFYTNSRGAVLSILGMMAYYFKDRFTKKMAVTLAVVVGLAVVTLAPSRMSEVSSKESSAHERTWLWEQGLQLLKENPVFGVGRGQFHKRVDLQLLAHNNYVQNFAELGLVGFFCFMSFLWFCWKGSAVIKSNAAALSPGVTSLGRMVSAMLVGYGIVTFFVVMELDLLYFVMGLCMAIYLVARRENEVIERFQHTKADLKMILLAMGAIIFAVWLAAVKQIL